MLGFYDSVVEGAKSGFMGDVGIDKGNSLWLPAGFKLKVFLDCFVTDF